MEFLEVNKLGTSFPLHELRAMQTQTRTWGRGLKKSANKREYGKIYTKTTTSYEPKGSKKIRLVEEVVNLLAFFKYLLWHKLVLYQLKMNMSRDFLLFNVEPLC